MKKLYLLGLTALLISFSQKLLAVTYNTITDGNPSNYTWSNPLFWQGGIVPANPCINCTINVYSPVTIDHTVDGTELDATGGVVQVFANVTLTINSFLNFTNTQIIVGSDGSSPSAIVLNDQVYLGGTSAIKIVNTESYIDTNNGDGNTVQGPYDFFGSNPGFAGIWAEATPPIGTFGYTIPLTALGEGSATTVYDNPYQLNCNGLGPYMGAPTCVSGVIFGPVNMGIDPAKPGAGLVFIQGTVLPVDLVQFLASKNADGSVKVIWATAQEANASHFDVERSSDKSTFTKIGEVTAVGNSSITSNYSFTDHNPLSGTAFYRLKMIDLDAKFKYGPIAIISSEADNTPIVVYSNPFSDQIRVKVNVPKKQTLNITVSDVQGRNYIRQTYDAGAGDNLIYLTPVNAASGMYILKIHGAVYDQTIKLIKK